MNERNTTRTDVDSKPEGVKLGFTKSSDRDIKVNTPVGAQEGTAAVLDAGGYEFGTK
ncbi:MAG TPA: hypothetical protein VL401_00130 [Alphaproteobacteria bacterium]|jgi:hypothetical protein|nr:hypothetical protein [Alphaproteobacteria bacterium]